MSDNVQLSYKQYSPFSVGDYHIDPIADGKDVHGSETMRVQLKAKSGKSFIFEISQQTIAIKTAAGRPLSDKERKEAMLGESLITSAERTEVFRYILAHKRQHTIGDESGWRGAAIVVSDDGQAYAGVNTLTQKPYFKDCAEQNAVNALVSRSDIYPEPATGDYGTIRKPPKMPQVGAVYIMGGREKNTAGKNDPGSYLCCPCGKCTDMLSTLMDKNAPVYSLPVPQETVLRPLSYTDEKQSPSINQIDTSKSQIAWVTPISHLNSHREIRLSDKGFTQKGAAALRNRLDVKPGDAEKLRREQPSSVLESMLNAPSAIVMNVIKESGKFGLEMKTEGLSDPLARRAAIAAQAVENILLNRESIPELDAAAKQGEAAQFAAINHFMVDRIEAAVADRVYAAYTKKPDKYSNATDALKDVGEVACVVIQLSDGTFYTGMEAVGAFDKASPAAEVNALSAAMARLGSNSVKNVWVMEYDPKDIARGVMETSPKEGVERILKRLKSGTSLDFHFVPFNDGSTQSAEIASRLTQHFSPAEIFPGLFTGNNNSQSASATR